MLNNAACQPLWGRGREGRGSLVPQGKGLRPLPKYSFFPLPQGAQAP